MTAPKPLLPCPERPEAHRVPVTATIYADWWQDVARRAMEYAEHREGCQMLYRRPIASDKCRCGLDELRAAISKAIEGAK